MGSFLSDGKQFMQRGNNSGCGKDQSTWQIPDDAKRLADGRISSGKYLKAGAGEKKKALPVGISDYVRAQSEYYYVDKTLYKRILSMIRCG